ncbi:substrate-binding domain-containing protein [Streptomyces sp. H27-D2]|uniref:substrate-binding domain-containing protein n=1 Tax=Streptomyces sp. H27-D2 TaxID=3046304 RepID=UPI002DB81BD5|nr:substrate-binding domain-containing protein [Streptomyces sp. H27-D2]MEC4019862.1 substrate-binding domain-containing protein [Streptomyces sp. H27-D2]
MGRHSLPDGSDSDGAAGGPTVRRRTVLISTALVLVVAAGAVVTARGDLLPFGGGCDGESVRLDVVASPDIAPSLRAVADRARTERVKSDGRCLDVKVTARSGHEVADSLSRPTAESDFQVWLPDSSLWVERAAASNQGVSLDSVGRVATSPLAFAAVPAAAKKLGWPKKTYSWAEAAEAASGDKDLRLGTADPARSATGLLALARISAPAGKKDDAAETRAAAAAKLLSEHTADDDDQVLATLPRDDSGAEQGNPRRNQTLILSEQAAHAHNTGQDGGPELSLFYPEDGTAELDYPYTVVNDDALTTDQTRAATRFMTLLGDDDGRAILQRHGFRLSDGTAGAALKRAAGARAPQPFDADVAQAPSAKKLRSALGMWTVTVQSARLTTVVDASASMAAPVPGRDGRSRMDVTKASLLRALAEFTPEDEIGLWEFATLLDGSRDYREIVPTGRLGEQAADGRTQQQKLTTAFGALEPVPGGATGLFDTTLAAYRDALDTYASGRFNAVVLLTDGANEDPGSVSRSALMKELKKLADPKRPVPLIAIAVGPDADQRACEEIADATGGSAHQVDDPAQIHAVILKAIMSAGQRRP